MLSLCLKKYIFFIFVLLVFPINSVFGQNQEIMPVKDVLIGMKGYGKTVVAGRKIERFDVEVLGILHNNKINENLLINGRSILVKVSGDVIKKAGGIAAGMSGSPVYIDNKLVGGISSGWLLTDHTVGLVTPIEEMLEIWTYPDLACSGSKKTGDKDFEFASRSWVADTPITINGKTIKYIQELPFGTPASKELMFNEALFVHTAGEIYIDGLDGRAAELFKAKAKGSHVVLNKNVSVSFPDKYDFTDRLKEASDAFEPGAALGLQLARGDINMASLGTMTHRSGHKILALAHPFLKKGAVSYLMTGAFIHHSFASVEMPFKIGAPTEMLGTITQDREKGIGGYVGRIPEMVPISIDVFDKDLRINRNINYQIVKDVSVFGMVLESTLVQALEGVVDRIGAGTAQMSIGLDCVSKAGKNHSFRRENLFFSKNDIIQSLTSEVSSLVEMVTESEHEEVMPTRLILKIELEKRRRTVQIEKVEVKNTSVSSGGILEVEVVLKPFREKKFVRKVKLPMPQDMGRENLVLSVYGLNTKSEDSDILTSVLGGESKDAKSHKDFKSSDDGAAGFESVIRSWVNSPKNSDILFQLTVEGDENKKLKFNGNDFEIQPTNLVVSGRIDTTLTLSEE